MESNLKKGDLDKKNDYILMWLNTKGINLIINNFIKFEKIDKLNFK